MQKHWSDSFIYSVVYVILIFGGQNYMQKRSRFDLRPALATWSSVLAIFSIFGAVRTIPELVSSLKDHGMQYSVCIPSYYQGVTGVWCFLFTVSKVYELGDTIFIVLRKQQLIFLHWYHHITVLIYVWYSYPVRIGAGRWFMVMNFAVHSIMYTYYALRAMRVTLPKFINMLITGMQITQMIVGCYVNIIVYNAINNGDSCEADMMNIKYSTLMYLSYFVLFAHFFYSTYIQKPNGKGIQQPNGKNIQQLNGKSTLQLNGKKLQ